MSRIFLVCCDVPAGQEPALERALTAQGIGRVARLAGSCWLTETHQDIDDLGACVREAVPGAARLAVVNVSNRVVKALGQDAPAAGWIREINQTIRTAQAERLDRRGGAVRPR